MSISLDDLKAQEADLAKQLEEIKGHFFRTDGALQMVKHLLSREVQPKKNKKNADIPDHPLE